jgi:hypothetical protein
MTPEEYLQDKYIFFATPCYGGSCGEPYLRSMMEMTAFLAKSNIAYSFASLANESLVTRARNKLVKQFLKTDATHLFFIDSDIRFNFTDPIKIVLHDKDVVVGAYPMKSQNLERLVGKRFSSEADIRKTMSRYVTNFVFESPEAEAAGELAIVDGLVEVHDAGTGFMCIKREVIEKMIEAYPETEYIPERENEPSWALFDTMIDDDKRYLSEDYTFCRRWQKLGGKIQLDPDVRLDHFGSIVYMGVPLFNTEEV